ncbi:MAG: UbiX family flavin prenyltransferase [Phycisphaerales bacterium]|jgi:4-hydroxy-3-polyprenylbenzoate decarboxylase|nr:UbiX family flavin prenyltransferase [Phycisphaerales bacterium]
MAARRTRDTSSPAPATASAKGSSPRPLAPDRKRIVVGISGASGAKYATRLIEELLTGGHEVHLVATEYGRQLLHDELGITRLDLASLVPTLAGHAAEIENRTLYIHPHKDVGAVIASGSFLHDGMVVIPCSSTALGYIATGSGSNLLGRAAMVTLKERRTLILVHRESPLNLIDIKNMEAVTLAGGIIAPANPGFYLLPTSVDEIIDFTVGKVLDLLKIQHTLKTRWADRKAEIKRGRGGE